MLLYIVHLLRLSESIVSVLNHPKPRIIGGNTQEGAQTCFLDASISTKIQRLGSADCRIRVAGLDTAGRDCRTRKTAPFAIPFDR